MHSPAHYRRGPATACASILRWATAMVCGAKVDEHTDPMGAGPEGQRKIITKGRRARWAASALLCAIYSSAVLKQELLLRAARAIDKGWAQVLLHCAAALLRQPLGPPLQRRQA